MLGPISRPSKFAPRGLPLQRSAAAQFDEVVAIEVTRLEKRLPQVVARVEFAIEDVPNLDLDAVEIPLTHSTGGTSHEPYRIVVFRRPIELRAERVRRQPGLAGPVRAGARAGRRTGAVAGADRPRLRVRRRLTERIAGPSAPARSWAPGS